MGNSPRRRRDPFGSEDEEHWSAAGLGLASRDPASVRAKFFQEGFPLSVHP